MGEDASAISGGKMCVFFNAYKKIGNKYMYIMKNPIKIPFIPDTTRFQQPNSSQNTKKSRETYLQNLKNRTSSQKNRKNNKKNT